MFFLQVSSICHAGTHTLTNSARISYKNIVHGASEDICEVKSLRLKHTVMNVVVFSSVYC